VAEQPGAVVQKTHALVEFARRQGYGPEELVRIIQGVT
jgi:hypothetical protein